jgi:GNAT superfamily N-acetyltransferase
VQTVVRLARGDDEIAVERLFVQAARAVWAHFIPLEGLARLSLPQRWRSETTLVAETDDGEVVGFAVLRRSEDADADFLTGELDLIYTSPGVWGSGVGRTLMVAALNQLRAAGYREATLWTAEPNERPRQFYELAGWSLDGTERSRTTLGATLTEVRYRIELSSARS